MDGIVSHLNSLFIPVSSDALNRFMYIQKYIQTFLEQELRPAMHGRNTVSIFLQHQSFIDHELQSDGNDQTERQLDSQTIREIKAHFRAKVALFEAILEKVTQITKVISDEQE